MMNSNLGDFDANSLCFVNDKNTFEICTYIDLTVDLKIFQNIFHLLQMNRKLERERIMIYVERMKCEDPI